MNRCRFAWYEGGKVQRHITGQQRPNSSVSEPSYPARLITGPDGIIIVEASMDGNNWFGTLTPKLKQSPNQGLVILYETPAAR